MSSTLQYSLYRAKQLNRFWYLYYRFLVYDIYESFEIFLEGNMQSLQYCFVVLSNSNYYQTYLRKDTLFFQSIHKNTSHLCQSFVCLHTMVHYKRLNLIIEVLNHILSIYIIVIINDILSNHECITSYDGLNDKSHTAAGRSYWTLHTFRTWRQR